MSVPTISVNELKSWLDEGKDFQLVDVREKNEYAFCNIGGELIPLSEINQHVEKFNLNRPVVVMCRSGKRSETAIYQLKQKGEFDHLLNLEGGILQWSDEIDPTIPKY